MSDEQWWKGRCQNIAALANLRTDFREQDVSAWQVEQVLIAAEVERKRGDAEEPRLPVLVNDAIPSDYKELCKEAIVRLLIDGWEHAPLVLKALQRSMDRELEP